MVPLVLAAVLVFVNAVGGDMVYDDKRVIGRNVLIQDETLVWKALTSDAWAFKGDATVAASNYWRPTFTAMEIVNFRLFGLETAGWHVVSIALHALVCILVFLSLRRWGFAGPLAFSISLIFAVHPTRSEVVAWMSAAPDLLFVPALFGSLWFARNYAEKASPLTLILMAALYAVALGAKEVAILCLPLFYLVMVDVDSKDKKKGRLNAPLGLLAVVAAIYFFARLGVIGALSRPPEDAPGLTAAVMSLPQIFAFYVRHIFFPYPLSVNYPIEAVTSAGMWNFAVPLAVSIVVLAALAYLVKTDRKMLLGAAFFLLPLIPAMNSTVFPSEQIVHDRYLYLPLLGVLMILVRLASRFLSSRAILIASVVIAAALSVQTYLANQVWADDLTLWSHARKVDGSSFAAAQYAAALYDAGRYDEAIREYTVSIDKMPRPRSYLERARALLKKQQADAAERDLKVVLRSPPDKVDAYTVYQAYESLGMIYLEAKNFEAAALNFAEARSKLPTYSAALTERLAIVLYNSGQKEQALRELESARTQARGELLPESKAVFLRLGMLYAEAGRKDDARSALREYISLTAAIRDPQTAASRAQAARVLENLK